MKKMSSTFLVVAALLCFTSGSLHSAVEAEKPRLDSNSETAKLLERIAQLEKRVAELEKRQSAQTTPPPPPGGDLRMPRQPQLRYKVPVLPNTPSYPQGWKQKEINGMKYYIVPLSLSGKSKVSVTR